MPSASTRENMVPTLMYRESRGVINTLILLKKFIFKEKLLVIIVLTRILWLGVMKTNQDSSRLTKVDRTRKFLNFQERKM